MSKLRDLLCRKSIPEPEEEPKVVVNKTEQLDGKIVITLDIPDRYYEKCVFAEIKTVDGKISELTFGNGRREYHDVGKSFVIWASNASFEKNEIEPLLRVLHEVLDQVYWTKKEES